MKAIIDLIKFFFFIPAYMREQKRKNFLAEKLREFQLWSLQNVNAISVWDYEEFEDISEIVSVRKIK